MSIDVKNIKMLREETGAGVMEVKQALEKFDGDAKKALEELKSKFASKAEKKAGRTASDGLVYSYIHNKGKMGSLVVVNCETDFVAKTDDFQNFCKEVAMQICTEDYEDVSSLLSAEYMRDTSKSILDLLTALTAKLGEKIEIREFTKYSVK